MTDAPRLLILADDFTGACDAAAPFAVGRGTLVLHGVPAQWPNDAEGIEVLSVDLDLRERTNAQAEAVASETARQLPSARVFLKIDSTLRGPIAGLVAGALAGSARQLALVAPAFPEQGRLLLNGRVVVNGQAGASVTHALGMDATALLGANFARSPDEVEVAVEHARMRGARHVVVDADGPACLQNVARAWQRHPEWLLVGSGGLARQVAHGAGHRTAKMLTSTRRPILVIAGSPAPRTQVQLDRLHALGRFVLVSVETPAPSRPSGVHEVIVVRTSPAAERDAGEAARALADLAAIWAADFRPGAVILTGGATARSVCERLGVEGIRLNGEFQPGVPHGVLHGGLWHGVRVVTKAGGFGTPDTLLDVVHALGVSSVAEPTHD